MIVRPAAHFACLLISQELRGGRLDHERREMNEHRETATAAMDQAIPCLAGDSASGRVEEA